MTTRMAHAQEPVARRLERMERTPDEVAAAVDRQEAEERQYRRHDAGPALDSLRRRREETLALLRRLTPAQWRRGSIHVTLGRMTFAGSR